MTSRSSYPYRHFSSRFSGKVSRNVGKTMWLAILFLALSGSSFSASRPGKPKLVRIKAPKGASIAILAQPRADSEKKDTARDGDILQVAGREGGFVKVRLSHKRTFGFVPNGHTVPFLIIPSRGD